MKKLILVSTIQFCAALAFGEMWGPPEDHPNTQTPSAPSEPTEPDVAPASDLSVEDQVRQLTDRIRRENDERVAQREGSEPLSKQERRARDKNKPFEVITEEGEYSATDVGVTNYGYLDAVTKYKVTPNVLVTVYRDVKEGKMVSKKLRYEYRVLNARKATIMSNDEIVAMADACLAVGTCRGEAEANAITEGLTR